MNLPTHGPLRLGNSFPFHLSDISPTAISHLIKVHDNNVFLRFYWDMFVRLNNR